MSFPESLLEEYQSYLPPLTKRPDFDEFWARTIAEKETVPLDAVLERQDYPSPYVRVYALTYAGFDGTPVHGWYLLPAFTPPGKLPILIQYHGFTGSRGYPHEYLPWVMLGMAVVAVDCRQQGGDTGTRARFSTGLTGNVNSQGLLDPEEYYYRAVYMDCMKAIDFAAARPELDEERIVLTGVSQGGALTMALAALDSRPCAAMADVPSNSNIEVRIEGEYGSFSSVTEYLRRYPDRLSQVYAALSYFDTMNLADRITCPVFASVALRDTTCPAKCFYATYNRITAPKQIVTYPFNGHDGCRALQMERKMAYLAEQGILNRE